MQRLFLDSSVVFTAVNSATGGSAKLFTVSTWQLVTTPFVLTEVERNVRKKLYDHHLERFFLLVEHLTILQLQFKPDLFEQAKCCIALKDAHILAEAKVANTNILVTLDRKHFFTPSATHFLQPQQVMTPQQVLAKLH